MTTLLKSEGICAWCGKTDAQRYCVCKQASFCDRKCQKALWSEHRLICKGEWKYNTAGKHLEGDVVKIHGLTSEKGNQMNGLLAEVISFNKDKERYEVIFTMQNCVVKTALLKSDNLKLHISILNGAKECSRAKLSETGKEKFPEQVLMRLHEMIKSLKSLNGRQIMEKLRKNDAHLLQAITMGGGYCVSSKQSEQILDNGAIDWVLEQFQFPLHLDKAGDPTFAPSDLLSLLITLLNKHQLGMQKEDKLNRYRVEACKKMAPLIMLVASKKHRMYKKCEHWVGLQLPFASLLQNCMLADRLASSVLLTKLDPHVRKTILNHCVCLFSSNPNLFLRKKSAMVRNKHSNPLDSSKKQFKMTIMPAILELMDYNSVGEARVTQIGKIKIPPGVTSMSGQPFAAVFLHLSAVAVIDEFELASGARRGGMQVMEEIQYMYSCLNRCAALKDLMGPFDGRLADVQTGGEMLAWAKKSLSP